MSTPTDPRHEYSSTYFVQDRESEAELTRLQIQDQMFTASMGGVLSEQADPTRLKRVLDVGCGTGGWLIETAKAYPTISKLIGVDVNRGMLDYAQAQARAQQVDDRVEFHLMDALLMLEFPTNYFDLVNERLGDSYLRTWDWPKLLREFQRVSRRGGVIRLTEGDAMQSSSSLSERSRRILSYMSWDKGGQSC
jgi:ubiquinone/menaquinone biosynthesis C-methylase UbiE